MRAEHGPINRTWMIFCSRTGVITGKDTALVPRNSIWDLRDGNAYSPSRFLDERHSRTHGPPIPAWQVCELNVRPTCAIAFPSLFFSLEAGSFRRVERAGYIISRIFKPDVDRSAGQNYDPSRRLQQPQPADFHSPIACLCAAPREKEYGIFLTERYCLYTVHRSGCPWYHHLPWQCRTPMLRSILTPWRGIRH